MYGISVFTIALLLVVPNVESQETGCQRTHMGTNFRFFFMSMISQTRDDAIYVSIEDPEASSFVTITGPTNTNLFIPNQKNVAINNNNRLNPNTVEDKGITLAVTPANRIALFGLSKEVSSCEGFLVLPTEALGTDYYAVTYFPIATQALVAVGATEDDTTITFEFQEGRGVFIQYKGEPYAAGLPLTETLNNGQTLQLGVRQDLSGTRIRSNKPIVVMCAGQYEPVSGSTRGNMVSQIPPTSQWGTLFYAVYLENRQINHIKWVAQYAGTRVRALGTASVYDKIATVDGDFDTFSFDASFNMVTLYSDRPIMVMQFGSSESLDNNEGNDPLMVYLPSKQQYLSSYSFDTFAEASSTTKVLIVVEVRDINQLSLNGDVINPTQWRPMPQAPSEAQMFSKTITLATGRNEIRLLNGNTFGAIIYGSEGSPTSCSFAFPAGMCTDPVEITTPAPPTTPTTPPPAICTDPLYLPFPGHSGCAAKSPNWLSSSNDAWDGVIVNIINSKRSEVNPTARNMIYMTWDTDLAYVAQQWANSCPTASDLPAARLIPNKYPTVGQNMYEGIQTSTWSDAISAWENQKDNFIYESAFQTADVNDYTQMVWANTYKVGCGDAKCRNDNQEFTVFFCNFAPAGNVENQVDPTAIYTPYVRGQPCADCPNDCRDNACDCSTKVCFNDGVMSATCQCTCRLAYHDPNDCSLRCDLAQETNTICDSVSNADCVNSPQLRDLCPFRCEVCPTPSTTTVTVQTTATTTLAPVTSPTSGPLPNCGCPAVQVTGTRFDFPSRLPGIYKLYNCQENGRPTYVSDDGTDFVYYDNLTGEWVIMRDGLGTGTMVYRNFAPAAAEPWDVTSTWEFLIEEEGDKTYEPFPEVSVTCMCNQPVCQTYRFETQGEPLPADFQHIAEFNGRPWYQMSFLSQNLNLYFHRDTNQGCSYWKVGTFGSNDAVLMAYDVAVNPYDIKAPWMAGNGATFSTIDDYNNGIPNVISKFTCLAFRP